MSTELKTIRKKRTASEAAAPTPVPEGDHRKRRRNRTTQSCLNCHTSKRMCDRKRPCGRCTQLGLTGLCVYEVDDPSQRADAQDESSRLRKRVAELEGVVRELKNKPHPRWAQTGPNRGEDLDKWHSRAQSRPASEKSHSATRSQSSASSPRSTEPPAETNESINSCNDTSSPNQPTSLSASYPPVLPQPSTDNTSHTSSYPSYFSVSSPISTPSSAIMTPTDGFSRPHAMIAGEQTVPRDFDLASIFMSYPGMMGCEDGAFGHAGHVPIPDSLKENQIEDMRSKRHQNHAHDVHCGCLNESSGYNVVLELSLRLRKAVDALSRSANHQMGSGCLLNQRIAELDHLATTTLGNINIPPNDYQLSSQPRPSTNPSTILLQSTAFPSNTRCAAPNISPDSLQGLRSWDVMSSFMNSPSSCDDSFMSWEPSRRAQ